MLFLGWEKIITAVRADGVEVQLKTPHLKRAEKMVQEAADECGQQIMLSVTYGKWFKPKGA